MFIKILIHITVYETVLHAYVINKMLNLPFFSVCFHISTGMSKVCPILLLFLDGQGSTLIHIYKYRILKN